jgi:hypothetical protein
MMKYFWREHVQLCDANFVWVNHVSPYNIIVDSSNVEEIVKLHNPFANTKAFSEKIAYSIFILFVFRVSILLFVYYYIVCCCWSWLRKKQNTFSYINKRNYINRNYLHFNLFHFIYMHLKHFLAFRLFTNRI